MRLNPLFAVAAVLLCAVSAFGVDTFVRVSPRDCRYFELSDGTAYIPIGLNMIAPYGRDEAEALGRMDTWMKTLSQNGGNFIRIWASNDFFDVEHEQSGRYDAEKARRLDAVLDMADRYGIRVKFTIEHFRHFFSERQSWANKNIHHVSLGGPAENVSDFFSGEKSREQFKRKLDWYAGRYGNRPAVFAWELWNEVNCGAGGGVTIEAAAEQMEWTGVMLDALHEKFPRNLATQSLGSFDNDRVRDLYRMLSVMPNNDVAQVHRYLDLGASLEVCKGPVDVLAADAIGELRAFNPGKPLLLAESGAVEPSHSGPFKLYDKDKDGIILHDVLFAPFFAGAAGAGQCWHWDKYVEARNLWFQFGRFAEAVKGIDPPAEAFEPIRLDQGGLRVYALKGKTTFIAWCRDSQSTWETELAKAQPPQVLSDVVLDVSKAALPRTREAKIYNPWTDMHTTAPLKDGKITLPPFQRSIVVRLSL